MAQPAVFTTDRLLEFTSVADPPLSGPATRQDGGCRFRGGDPDGGGIAEAAGVPGEPASALAAMDDQP
jgi:hypothetical protein